MGLEKFKCLFQGLKVFLGREVPREPFAFALRAFGAEVSWEKTGHTGAPFDVKDLSITHHLVDRPVKNFKKIANRTYVQPQWVFDCINQREVLPCAPYFPGAMLPPHRSPFDEELPVEEEDL